MKDANTCYLNHYLHSIEADERRAIIDADELAEHEKNVNIEAEKFLSTIDASTLINLFNEVGTTTPQNKNEKLLMELVHCIHCYFRRASSGHATQLGFAMAAYLKCNANEEISNEILINTTRVI